ncbi:hypothetical protein DRN63_02800 [Nanoarchaeota archaeon]|nr:MAG: hypothetical protein DRN63_02800 [Nanoarchaeota archaeon]
MGIFDKFRKKEEKISFPSEEKVVPAFPKSQPIKPKTELPEIKPPKPTEVQPPLPPYPGREIPKPEPLQQPKQKPMVPEVRAPKPPAIPPPPPLPEIKLPELPEIEERRARPAIYIKVSKYRELLDSMEKLKASLKELKRALEEYKYAKAQEEEKLAVCNDTVRKVEEIIKFFEKTFTQPEE